MSAEHHSPGSRTVDEDWVLPYHGTVGDVVV